MTDTLKELWDAMDEFNKLQEECEETLERDAEEFWQSLDMEDKLLAFYSVVKRINQGELVDKGSYRYVLYDVFGFGPESYMIGMACGYMPLHNAIGDGETYQEMKQAERLEVVDENGRAYVKYLEKDEKLRYNMQDEGKTLKIFVDKVKYVKLEDNV